MRDINRDVARGLTVLEMETVNLSDLNVFAHADVQDYSITYADTVFPHFAFLAGMSPMSPKRSVTLVGLGLVYNSLNIIRQGKDFKPRPVGVLQRTGLASLILNSLPSSCPRYQMGVSALYLALTVGLARNPWAPFESTDGTAQSRIDKLLLGDKTYRPDYDPEGLLGALGTAVNMWFGAYYEIVQPEWLESLRVGGGAIALGTILSKVLPKFFPVSKPFWTTSFVFITGGYSVLKQSLIYALVPYLPAAVQHVLSCLGQRSIEIFFASALVQNVAGRTGVWAKLKGFFSKYLGGEVGGDLAMLALNNSLMALLATCLVKHNLRLRF